MLMGWLAMVNTPTRPAAKFPETVNVTVPGPVPEVGENVTQGTLLATDHAHPAAV